MAAWSPRPLKQDSFQPRPSPARRVLWEHPGWLGGGEETGKPALCPPGCRGGGRGQAGRLAHCPSSPRPPACARLPLIGPRRHALERGACFGWPRPILADPGCITGRYPLTRLTPLSQARAGLWRADQPPTAPCQASFRGSPVVAPTLPQPGSGGRSPRAPGPRAATFDWSWPARAPAGHRDAPALWLRLSRVIPSPARTRASSPEMTVWGRGRPRKCRACALVQPGPWWVATTPGHSHPGPASPGRGPAAQVWRPRTQGPCNPATLSLLQWLLPKVERGGE